MRQQVLHQYLLFSSNHPCIEHPSTSTATVQRALTKTLVTRLLNFDTLMQKPTMVLFHPPIVVQSCRSGAVAPIHNPTAPVASLFAVHPLNCGSGTVKSSISWRDNCGLKGTGEQEQRGKAALPKSCRVCLAKTRCSPVPWLVVRLLCCLSVCRLACPWSPRTQASTAILC